MFTKSRRILVLVCILAGSLCLLGAGPDASAPSISEEKAAAVTFAHRSLLVEAFVIEVNLPALAQQGVSLIGRQPHAVTVADIARCLESGQARVIDGAKIATRDGMNADINAKRTIYVRRGNNLSPYDSGAALRVDIVPATEATVSARFSFTSARFAEKPTDSDTPPTRENWEWSGMIALRPGEPQIAGAAQNNETAVFLLLVANAQSE